MTVVVPWDRVALGLELPVLPGKPIPNPVVRARELQAALAEHGTASEVARALGLTRAGVSQYLTLLRRLPPDLLAKVESEQEPARLREMSLRNLMAIAKLEGVGDRRRRLRALVKRPKY
jgi:ParB-like chromosome segregation protein Spo0J